MGWLKNEHCLFEYRAVCAGYPALRADVIGGSADQLNFGYRWDDALACEVAREILEVAQGCKDLIDTGRYGDGCFCVDGWHRWCASVCAKSGGFGV